MKGLIEIWLRLKNWKDIPLFFKRMRNIAIFSLPFIYGAIERYPELNVVVWIFNKGEEYQDIIRLMPVIGLINMGIAAAATFALNEEAKKKMEKQLDKPKDIV